MILPADHPQRRQLNDEVHARPPELMVAPLRVSYLALLTDATLRERQWRQVGELARRFGAVPPAPDANHYSADLGRFRLKCERHTEFTRYKLIVPGTADDPFAEPAIEVAPADWLAELPGQVMVAAHVALVSGDSTPVEHEALAVRLFDGNVLVGGQVADGAATALTDLRIHGDGFSRFLVQDRTMTPRQAGRTVQRLLEIDTYRIMALLALPVARALTPFLADRERELVRITEALATAGVQDEPALLQRLTRLEAEIESRELANHDRFSAAAAYHELVQRRIVELREQRIDGLQTFKEFTERRLAPAVSTCRVAAERQEALSRHVARTTQLLSTRVDITLESQNQAVLASMNRRAELQLRLQQTVEGLSVAAVTYYVVGLIGYLAAAVEAAGYPLDAKLVAGISIPVVALLIALRLRRFRKSMRHVPG